jgi:hypothetical protein
LSRRILIFLNVQRICNYFNLKEFSMKQNCWEYKKCGRERGGSKESELGICPAAMEKKLDGIHGGSNAGRSCWIVVGTFCSDEIRGKASKEKIETCTGCNFYKVVKTEEHPSFVFSGTLLTQMME